MRYRRVIAVLVLCVCRSAHAVEIPLTVVEPVGVARSEVASGGIPLPEGKYRDPAAFSLSRSMTPWREAISTARFSAAIIRESGPGA